MPDSFEDLEFLMGSENRIRVLESLLEGPRSRPDLVADVGSSRVTVGRILDDLLERGWIEYGEDGYRVSVLGEAVAVDLVALERTVAVAQEFQPLVEYFSRETLDFDPRWLADAEMGRSPSDSAFEHVDFWAQLFRAADRFRSFTPHVPVTLLEVLIEQLQGGDIEMSSVLTGSLIDDLLADPAKRTAFREMISLGAEIYRYDGSGLDYAIGLYDDDKMSLAGFDDYGTPTVKMVSTNPRLREWAESRVADYEADAHQLTVEDLQQPK